MAFNSLTSFQYEAMKKLVKWTDHTYGLQQFDKSFLKKNNAPSLQVLLLRSPLMASSYPAEIKEDPLPLSQLHRVKEDAMPLNPPRFQIRFIPTRLKMCSSVLFVWKDFEMRIYVHTVQNYAVTNAFEGRGL